MRQGIRRLGHFVRRGHGFAYTVNVGSLGDCPFSRGYNMPMEERSIAGPKPHSIGPAETWADRGTLSREGTGATRRHRV